MKIFKLPQLADLSDNGQYLLDCHDLGSTSAYMIYGRMRPKETARKISTEAGSEEIIFMLKGTMRVKAGKSQFMVSAGEAFLLKEAQPFYLDNPEEEEAIYIAAGAKAYGALLQAEPSSPTAGLTAPDETPGAVLMTEAASEEDFEITRDEGSEGTKESD